MSPTPNHVLQLAPAVFVLLWSTGWISARAIVGSADPLTFLSLRFALAALVMAALCGVLRAEWPTTARERGHALLSGVLLHAGYLGPVWWAVGQGVPAGVSGVIAGSQPLLTALLAPVLIGERITYRQWVGVVVGFAGIILVLQPKLAALSTVDVAGLGWPLFINALGMVSVTLGTFYQKRFLPSGDLRTMATWQYIGSAAAVAWAAWMLEPMRLTWTWPAVLTMAWSVIGLSIAAVLLLLWLIRGGAVSQAAALIYLVPAAVVIEAWLLFGETITLLQGVGVAVTAVGVAFAVKR